MSLDFFISQAVRPKNVLLDAIDYVYAEESKQPNDRAIDVNAPSQVGKCSRENYFARTQVEGDSSMLEPRTARIFEMGHQRHERLQEVLRESGILIMDEIPLIHKELNIQGHSDGLIQINKIERAILEIKTMNHFQFSKLEQATDNHISQAMVYLLCAEERRKELQRKYSTVKEFEDDYGNRKKAYEERYQHLESGRKYTREEKLANQVRLHDELDSHLITTIRPIDKVVFLYENKNDQSLKEFVVERDDELIAMIKEKFMKINESVEKGIMPDKEGKGKSDYTCKFCNYRSRCW